MKRLLFLLFLTITMVLSAQETALDSNQFKIAFYNVENLFDPSNDSLKNDDAFTPEGLNRWTYKRMYRKINNIAKVIIAMGNGSPPAIVAMAEIENLNVLKKLCYQSPLAKYKYSIVHYESPDMRGIEVALIYRKEQVNILHSEAIPIVYPFDSASRNRDILYVVSQFPNGDSLHLFVNHWASRYGGYAPTIPKRNYFASVIKQKTDSIFIRDPTANIIITGDFNDYPTDESLSKILQAQKLEQEAVPKNLYNLMFKFTEEANIGTHKHEDFWGCLDQMIVSAPLLNNDNGLHIDGREAHIFIGDFMIEADEKYGGYKVYRTYLGPRYIGGYADHFPIFVNISSK